MRAPSTRRARPLGMRREARRCRRYGTSRLERSAARRRRRPRGRWDWCARRRASRWDRSRVGAVGGPLRHVARHVVELPLVSREAKTHAARPIPTSAPPDPTTGSLRVVEGLFFVDAVRVARGEVFAFAETRGVLPLRFGRQATALPRTKRERRPKVHADDRIVLRVPFERRDRGPRVGIEAVSLWRRDAELGRGRRNQHRSVGVGNGIRHFSIRVVPERPKPPDRDLVGVDPECTHRDAATDRRGRNREFFGSQIEAATRSRLRAARRVVKRRLHRDATSLVGNDRDVRDEWIDELETRGTGDGGRNRSRSARGNSRGDNSQPRRGTAPGDSETSRSGPARGAMHPRDRPSSTGLDIRDLAVGRRSRIRSPRRSARRPGGAKPRPARNRGPALSPRPVKYSDAGCERSACRSCGLLEVGSTFQV